jgi:2-aminoethylphosphonate-pyruvate transaminase
MSLASRDPILLTPGPLTTSLPTKMAMLRDWGSWDSHFNAVTADVRRRLVDVIGGTHTHVCVPMQGSGTFAVEAAVNTLVPRDGHGLVLVNGAYGKRMAKLVGMMGRRVSTFETADDVPMTADDVERLLAKDASITHVGLIHCETSTGILNPLPAIAAVVAKHKRALIVDAMSSSGVLPIDARTTPFDALVAAWQVRRRPARHGFVLARRDVLAQAKAAARRSRSISMTSGRTWRRRRSGASRRPRTSSSRCRRRSSSTRRRAGSRRATRAMRATAKCW